MNDYQEERKLLKGKSNYYIRKILLKANLTDDEFQLMQEFYLKDNYRENICKKLCKSIASFNTMHNQALLKVRFLMENLLKV